MDISRTPEPGLDHHPRDEGQDARPIHSSSTPADSRLIAPNNCSQRHPAGLRPEGTTHRLFYSLNFLTIRVQCAVDIQKAMKEANAKLSDDRAIVLRVGLNLGDVVVEDGDLYGDAAGVLHCLLAAGVADADRLVAQDTLNSLGLMVPSL